MMTKNINSQKIILAIFVFIFMTFASLVVMPEFVSAHGSAEEHAKEMGVVSAADSDLINPDNDAGMVREIPQTEPTDQMMERNIPEGYKNEYNGKNFNYSKTYSKSGNMSDEEADKFMKTFMGGGLIFGIVMFVVGIAGLIFWIFMLVDAAKRKSDSQVMWIIIIVLTGWIGALIYYFAVKRPADKMTIGQVKK